MKDFNKSSLVNVCTHRPNFYLQRYLISRVHDAGRQVSVELVDRRHRAVPRAQSITIVLVVVLLPQRVGVAVHRWTPRRRQLVRLVPAIHVDVSRVHVADVVIDYGGESSRGGALAEDYGAADDS